MLTQMRNAAPGPERREGERKRLMLRVAKLRCLGGEYPCVIHDVSETGVKLRLFHAHPADSHMFLELANGALYAIERRWMDGVFAGYRFSSRVEIDAFIAESCPEGGEPIRLRISCPVQVIVEGETRPAMLMDLSREGASFETSKEIAQRALLYVEFHGSPPRLGYVSSRKKGLHNVVFQEALMLGELAQLALQLQPHDSGEIVAECNAGLPRALSA
jgi:hypothetical protein